MKKFAFLAAMLIAVSGLSACQEIEDSLPDEPSAITTVEEVTTAPVTTTEEVTTTEAPPPPNPTVELFAAGDNLIHSSIYKQAKNRSEDGSYDFDYAYAHVAEIIPQNGIRILNQETLICGDEYEPSDYPCFNSPPELGDKMMALGFNVFSQANNHVLDKGRKGLGACLDYWAARPEVVTCGAYRDEADMQKIRTMEVDGIKFSFLGFTEHTNGIKLWTDTDYEVVYTSETAVMKQLVEKAQTLSDVVVVNVHWGVENSNTVTEAQKSLARDFVDWGADVIVGTHPHTIQSMEYIDKPDGTKAFVLYSLGNFISAQNKKNLMVGMAADMDITLDLQTRAVTISDIKATPIITHYTASYKNICNYPYYAYTEELASNHGVSGISKKYIDGLVSEIIPDEFFCADPRE